MLSTSRVRIAEKLAEIPVRPTISCAHKQIEKSNFLTMHDILTPVNKETRTDFLNKCNQVLSHTIVRPH